MLEEKQGRTIHVKEPRITVAICTWNRAHLLDQTLAGMCGLRLPNDLQWELLVVNNNCTDTTDKVIADYADRLPIRRLFEPEPGVSNARNCAVAEARGEYIVWTDDDVLADSQWLESYLEAFERWPNAAVFGGRIEPEFETEPPSWLMRAWDQVKHAYAVIDYGDEPVELSRRRVPVGPNIAYRAEPQRRFLYDPNLGIRPDSTMRGEETSVAKRMLDAGEQGWYVPNARVKHFITKNMLTKEYLWGYYFGRGQHTVIQRSRDDGALDVKTLWWLRAQVVRWEAVFRLRRLLCKPETWVNGLLKAAISRGRLDESLRLARRRNDEVREDRPGARPSPDSAVPSRE